MRRFTLVSTACLAFVVIGAGAALVMPEQTHAAGLDFWNWADEAAQLRDGAAQQQELDFELQQTRQRAAVGDHIAARLSEGAITPREALHEAVELAEISPDWVATLHVEYSKHFGAPLTATDRDLMTQFLHLRIEQMIRTAKCSGDKSRVAALSACLTRLDHEA